MIDTRTISPAEALTISGISSQFGSLVDHRRATECEALFTANARMIFGPGSPKPGTLDGIDAIRAFLISRQAQTHVTTRHIATNFRMRRTGPDVIEADSLLQVFRSDDETRLPTIALVCDVAEVFRLCGPDTWLIEQRLTTPIFSRG